MTEPPSQCYLIGIDTGGTYTDAVVIAAENHAVVASAKALTTRGDLAAGVREAMGEALAKRPSGFDPRAIALVSVSTTLATNAVVEGHGSMVCTVLVGFDPTMVARCGISTAFAEMPVAIIAGGHDHNGEEKAPLDEGALERAVIEHGAKVEAFAVAAQFAVRNAAHETRARDIIVARTRKPVTISSELSSALDAPRRALTATLNARLIARISNLIDAVSRAMRDHRIDCPLMIVKGDGTLALAETVASRPIETVLSGPAASVVGASWLSGRKSFILSDMGGTTTDVGILENGRPRVVEEGAEIGGWRTMVKAIDVKTVGLGGDSEVTFAADGRLGIGPQRIVPVSLLAARFPATDAILAAQLADPDITSLAGRFIMLPLGTGQDTSAQSGLSQREAEIMGHVAAEPKALAKVAVSAGAQRAVAALRRKGVVQIAGFTPSDAAHVLGLQANWSRPAAEMAAALTIRFGDMRMPTAERTQRFAREVWSETVRLSGRVLLEAAFLSAAEAAGAGEEIVDAVCRGDGGLGLTRIAISPSVPIVAVGAPVRIYYGEVGRRLACEVVFPEYCEVANAVGAATGVVARSISVQVAGDGGAFRVYAPEGTLVFDKPRPALERAQAVAIATARAAAITMGAGEPEIVVRIEKHLLPDAVDESGLFAATVTVEAIGRPAATAAPAGRRPSNA